MNENFDIIKDMPPELKRDIEIFFYSFVIGMCVILNVVMFYNDSRFEKERIQREQELKQHQIELDIELQRRLKELDEKYAKKEKEWQDEYNISALAANAYYESRGVGGNNFSLKEKDMENITTVVLNRWKSGKYGATIDDVLHQYKIVGHRKVCQFSWACDDNIEPIKYKSKEYKLAYKVAYNLYYGKKKKRLFAYHYYNPRVVKPTWAKNMKQVAYVKSGHKIVY